PASALKASAPLLGFQVPYSASSGGRPSLPGASTLPARSVLRVWLPSRRLASPAALRPGLHQSGRLATTDLTKDRTATLMGFHRCRPLATGLSARAGRSDPGSLSKAFSPSVTGAFWRALLSHASPEPAESLPSGRPPASSAGA